MANFFVKFINEVTNRHHHSPGLLPLFDRRSRWSDSSSIDLSSARLNFKLKNYFLFILIFLFDNVLIIAFSEFLWLISVASTFIYMSPP